MKENVIYANAANYTKKIANIRATVANTDFMEQKVLDLIKDAKESTSIQIIKGK